MLAYHGRSMKGRVQIESVNFNDHYIMVIENETVVGNATIKYFCALRSFLNKRYVALYCV